MLDISRGKRKDGGGWIEGYHVKYGWTGSEKDYIVPSYASALYAIEVDPATVGRYTGICDKNDKKIFGGDFIAIEFENDYLPESAPEKWTEIFEIYFDDEFHAWYTKILSGETGDWLYEYDGDCLVVGNIHDNPELLEAHNDEVATL